MLSLPYFKESTNKLINDEKTLNSICELLIKHAANVIERTSLKKYITEEQIRQNIKSSINCITPFKPNEFDQFQPIYNIDSIAINQQLFTILQKINDCQNDILNEYPDLIKILEITGLTLVFNGKYQLPFKTDLAKIIANYNTEQNYVLAIYFSNKENQIEDIPLNYIKIISYIIGEEELINAIINTDTYPHSISNNLVTKMFRATELYDECMVVTDKIFSLFSDIEQINYYTRKNNITKFLYNYKLKPLKSILEKFGDKKQAFIANSIKVNNYNLDNIPNIKKELLKHGLFLHLDEDEIKYIKESETFFLEKAKDHVNRFENSAYLKTGYKNWVLRTTCKSVIDMKEYDQKQLKINNKIEEINEKFITIFASLLKYNKLNLTPIEFENILNLMTLKPSDKKAEIKLNKTIKKIKRKIKRTKINKNK